MLKDKVCLITGGAAGIGMATAQKFGASGAKLIIADRNEMAVSAAVAKLRDGGVNAIGFTMDVRERASVDTVVASVLNAFGRIDVLVNNAGITKDAMLRRMQEQQFDDVIDVNLKGVFNCTQAVVGGMLDAGRGVVLNASSVVGIYGNVGQSNYVASKFGVIGLTKTWARELGPKGIRVNAVCPGFIGTEMLTTMPENIVKKFEEACWLRRLGKPEEIASVYAFLASDASSFINGAVIEASGGLTI